MFLRALHRAVALLRTSASPHAPTLVRERRPRDSQRSKLYRAERTVGAGHHFPSVAHCQAQVDRILASAWWKARFPALDQVQVRDGRGRRHAGAHQGHGAISLPRWSRRERIILHELAHLATPASFAAHGPEYAMVYLELVGHFMGATAARDLAEAFRAHRVRFATPDLAEKERPVPVMTGTGSGRTRT